MLSNHNMRKRLACQILTAGLASAALSASARRGAAEALNPSDYKSPSGRFVLSVDPTDIYGRGEGNYQITSNGVVVWSGKKPFTLCEAGITDDGIVGGYAYTHGLEGFAAKNGDRGE